MGGATSKVRGSPQLMNRRRSVPSSSIAAGGSENSWNALRAHPPSGDQTGATSLTGSAIIGGPETARERFDQLLADTAADELMVTTMVHDHADRIRSYELVADLFELSPVLTQ